MPLEECIGDVSSIEANAFWINVRITVKVGVGELKQLNITEII